MNIDFINDDFFSSNKLNTINRNYMKDSTISISENNKTLDLKYLSIEESNLYGNNDNGVFIHLLFLFFFFRFR